MMIDRNLLQLKLNFNYASNSNSDIMTLLWNLCHQHNIKNYIKNEFIINFYIKMLYIKKIMGSTLTFEKIFECTEVFSSSDESLLRQPQCKRLYLSYNLINTEFRGQNIFITISVRLVYNQTHWSISLLVIALKPLILQESSPYL